MKKLLTVAVGAIICLSLSGCGSTKDEDSERLALLESQIAELRAELRDSRSESNLSSEDSLISEDSMAERDTVKLMTLVEPSPAPEPDDSDRLYYSSLEELVELYRSGEWDGREEYYHRGDSRIASMSYTGEIEEYERGKDFGDLKRYPSNLYPDLPDGYIPADYIDCARYKGGDFSCLEADGVHIYKKGQEETFYPVDGITEDSAFIVLDDVGRCINTGTQIIDYRADGGYSVFLDNIVQVRQYDGGFMDIIMFHDGEVQWYSEHMYGDHFRVYSYTILKTVTAVACTGFGFNVIFTDVNGYTYIVNLEGGIDEIEAIVAGDTGNTDAVYRYCLGQEAPEYYIAEYEKMKEEYYTRSSHNIVPNPFDALISKYCE